MTERREVVDGTELDESGLGGAALLDIARETLRAVLGPLVPSEHRYELLMIANAMSIAARELEAGEGAARGELARLAALLTEDPAQTEGDAKLSERLDALNRRLASEIRAGAFDDGAGREACHRHLLDSALAAVRISNPQYLARRGLE